MRPIPMSLSILGLVLFSEAFASATASSTANLPGTLLYLDPGTGSLLFSAIAGIAGTAYFVARDLLYRSRSRLGLILSPRSMSRQAGLPTDDIPVALYSEGRQYEATFGPLLEQLAARNVPCLYLSSDPDDPLLALDGEEDYPLLGTECIGSGHFSWARLRTLRARLVCMTTPGLDVMQVRRSPHVEHYMHVIHSPTDKSFNRPYSFDFFDSVAISGPHQERVIRALEALRGRPQKPLHTVGCLYYDRLAPRYAAARAKLPAEDKDAPHQTTVLLAPTWGRNGLLKRCGEDLIRALASADMRVIIRPHPQSLRSERDLIDGLRQLSSSFSDCRWDLGEDPVGAMAASDILVSDISGIVFDFAFLTGRPVLTMDFPVDKRGFEAMDLDFEPWEIEMLDVVGRRISLENIYALEDIVTEELADSERSLRIKQARDRYVASFGMAAPAAADVIARIAEVGEVDRCCVEPSMATEPSPHTLTGGVG